MKRIAICWSGRQQRARLFPTHAFVLDVHRFVFQLFLTLLKLQLLLWLLPVLLSVSFAGSNQSFSDASSREVRAMEQQNISEVVAMAMAWQAHLDLFSKQVDDQRRLIQTLLVDKAMQSTTILSNSDEPKSGAPREVLAPSFRQTTGSSARTDESAVISSAQLQELQNIEVWESLEDVSFCGGLFSSVLVRLEATANAAASRHRVLGASCTSRLVKTKLWQLSTVFLILLNVGWVAFVTDMSMKNALRTYDSHAAVANSDWVLVVDVAFLLCFILELVVMILARLASRDCVHRDMQYLLMDAFVVFVGALEVVLTLCGITSTFIRNLRLLKIGRLWDLCHSLKHVRFFAKTNSHDFGAGSFRRRPILGKRAVVVDCVLLRHPLLAVCDHICGAGGCTRRGR